MSRSHSWSWAGLVCLFCVAGLGAPQDQPAGGGSSASASSVAAVPRLIKFSGMLRDLTGKPLTGPVDANFAIYKEQADLVPLWYEVQTLQLDEQGRYTVLLGAMQAEGLPMALFTSGEARWLEVAVAGAEPQPRTLLVSVPYALKAGDAETLGGKPASAFMPVSAESGAGQSVTTAVIADTGLRASTLERTTGGTPAPLSVTGTGTPNMLAKWLDTGGTLGNSAVFESGGLVGIGTASPTALVHSAGSSGAGRVEALRFENLGQMNFQVDVFGAAHPSRPATAQLAVWNAEGNIALVTDTQANVQAGTSTKGLFIQSGGNVGIGTTVPGEKLEVAGNVKASGSVTASSFTGDGAGLTSLNASYLYGAVSTTSSAVGVPGVSGTNTAGTGDTNGVYGVAASTEGTGVYGYASAGTGYTNGVYGSADSTDGTGVFGYASSATGLTDGVYGEAESTDGAGVYGRAAADTGETYGLYGEAQSTSGTGVLGYAISATGSTVGVAGKTGSSAGVAGLFDNLAGGNILLGQTNGAERFRVDGSGNVSASGSVTATSFSGSGAGLTNLTAANISAGTAGISISGNAATATTAATATNALSLGGITAANYARLDIGNSFNGNQSVTGNITLTGSINTALRLETTGDGPNVIGGYSGNTVTSGVQGATIAGGGSSSNTNTVTDSRGTVGGGTNNRAGDNAGTTTDKRWATVGGGNGNTASGSSSVVAGGEFNTASGDQATICGGSGNTASATNASVVGGGLGNTASGTSSSVVGGGSGNTASGNYSTVAGGSANTASGAYSFAAGRRAKANHQGALVWGDSTDSDITSSAADQFIARAVGGATFYTSTDLSTGVTVAAGGGSWSSVSDRSAKQNFASVDGAGLLARLASIPVLTWNYKAQDASIRHLGPMAQDFYAAFQVGEDDKHIATVDADGVALAAIQALYQRSVEKDRKIEQLSQEVDELRARLTRLEQLWAKK